MLISPKWEKQRSEPQAQMNKIVNVPLPCHQATKILRDLQTSCNSPNKRTQMNALQYWKAWVLGQNPEEWETDSLCHFAIKPLLTKKLQPLHKDSDISKMKLNIMWNLLASLENKFTMNGPKYILDNFIQSCFTWLASVGQLENDLSILILKLLMTLFKKTKNIITSGHYVFPFVQIDDVTLNKLFHSVIDKFLNVFDNWNKFQNNQLLINLWKWFLESCENSHNSVVTTVWHRIFKINQSICSDKSEPFKDKLEVLHACATKIKTVLASSKYIGGENRFTTPCEALLKKLSEICSIEDAPEPSPQDQIDIFRMSQETSQTLAHKSIQTWDYNLCIQFLDSLEDFSLRSSFWGSWSGLAMCYREFLLGINRSEFNKEQNKFYRKLRAPTANFDLDVLYLNESDVGTVIECIQVLNISCFCAGKNTLFNKTSQREPSVEIHEEIEMDVTENENDVKLDVVPATNHFAPMLDLNAGGRTMCVTLDLGKFASLDTVSRNDLRSKCLKTFRLDFTTVKNIFQGISRLDNVSFLGTAFQNIRFDFISSLESQRMFPQGKYLSSAPQSERVVEIPEITPELEDVPIPTTSQQSPLKQTHFFDHDPPKTYQTQNDIKPEKVKKKPKRTFEEVVHQILQKNKLRKSRRSIGEDTDNTMSPTRSVSSPRRMFSNQEEDPETTESLPENKTTTKTPKRTKGKDRERNSKTPTDGKLDHFFKILGPPANDNKDPTQTDTKCETPRRRTGKKGKKGSNNWKQTSLKTMMKEAKDKPAEETKNRKRRLDKSPDKPKSSRLKEALRSSREYSKTIHSSQVLSENHNNNAPSKKRPKKSQAKLSDTSEIENVDPEPETHVPQIEPDDDPNRAHLKDSPLKVDKHQLHHAQNSHQSPEPPENTPQIELPLEDFTTNIIKTEQQAEEGVLEMPETLPEIPQRNDQEGKLQSEERVEDAKFEGTQHAKEESALEEQRFRGNKRLLPSLEMNDMEIKKIKLEDDDGVAPLREIPEITSPSMKGKPVSMSSPRLAKASNRIIPTRISRMISLITPDSKPNELPKGESPTTQTHSLNVSPKKESKDRNRKFVGHERSSRVSKMLASLNILRGKETEEPTEEDKRGCEPTEATTPNGNALAAKLASPNSIKKRKFIGFDESKNQTVIYRIDTPPSQVLEEWQFMKEEYLNSSDVGGEGEAEEEDNSITSTPPSRKKKNKFSHSETSILILDTVSDT